ncbi:MAG: transglycosylase domain-containing protein [Clostridiales Family XIII bacterium]|nr:transglycosylase domain-containing protein [Clostridiales Family XIII bacterium]
MTDNNDNGFKPDGDNLDEALKKFDELSEQYRKSQAEFLRNDPEPELGPEPTDTVAIDEEPVTDGDFPVDGILSSETASETARDRVQSRRAGRAKKSKEKNMTKSKKGKSGGKNGKNGKNGKRKSSRGKRIAKWTLLVILVLGIIAVVVAAIYAYGIIQDAPKYDTNDIEKRLKVMSTIYDDEGNVVKNIYLDDGQRTLVTYDQIPQHTVDAFVAIEDKTFWKHHGFNYVRMVGAVKDKIFGGGQIGGTSTITQQLARNLWLSDRKSERSIGRKIEEAYYAYELEKNLSKKEILTAYLNMISLGNHSYGISAAAHSYFNKNVEDLDLLESAVLASLPKYPGKYAPIETVALDTVAEGDPRILLRGSQYCYLYNDSIEPRVKLVLKNMLEQDLITKAEYDAGVAENLREHLQPTEVQGDSNAAFFVSYAIDNVATKLMAEYPAIESKEEALQMVYSGGLEIHSTLSTRIQNIMADEYSIGDNFPAIRSIRYDSLGNIIDDAGKVMLFDSANIFGEGGVFTFSDDEYDVLESGDIIFYRSVYSRIGYYHTESKAGEDVNVEFKSYFSRPDGVLYMTNGGIINVPKEYKTMDEEGNMILSRAYFTDKDIAIKWTIDENNIISFGPENYTLRQSTIQPQSASVILDHHTGQIKGMMGGRNVTGEMNYNRAINPRQPGSSMKPIGTYGPAIEMGANKEPVSDGEAATAGTYWTAASIIVDEETVYQGKVWPTNWYGGYRGPTTLRKSVEQSMNVNAVRVQVSVGVRHSADFLKKLGITTLVEEGDNNDMNPAALALGGMTNGVTPLEITSAYGTFANLGVHVTPITYTSVTDKMGNVVLDGTTESSQAMNPGTAFIMNDILRTTVSQGIGGAAQVPGVPVAGKTGTTSDEFDLYFVGNTPKYSCGVWMGNDVNIPMAPTPNSASLFKKMMTRVCEGDPQGDFPGAPGNVVSASVGGITDYFIEGTVPEKLNFGNEDVDICLESGDRATPWCKLHEVRTFNSLNLFSSDEVNKAPEYYCNLHNIDPLLYPYNPEKTLDTTFDPNKKKETVKPVKKPEKKPKPTPKPKPPTPPDDGDDDDGGGDSGGDDGDGDENTEPIAGASVGGAAYGNWTLLTNYFAAQPDTAKAFEYFNLSGADNRLYLRDKNG